MEFCTRCRPRSWIFKMKGVCWAGHEKPPANQPSLRSTMPPNSLHFQLAHPMGRRGNKLLVRNGPTHKSPRPRRALPPRVPSLSVSINQQAQITPASRYMGTFLGSSKAVITNAQPDKSGVSAPIATRGNIPAFPCKAK